MTATAKTELKCHLLCLAVTTLVALGVLLVPPGNYLLDSCYVQKVIPLGATAPSAVIKWASGKAFFVVYYIAQIVNIVSHRYGQTLPRTRLTGALHSRQAQSAQAQARTDTQTKPRPHNCALRSLFVAGFRALTAVLRIWSVLCPRSSAKFT